MSDQLVVWLSFIRDYLSYYNKVKEVLFSPITVPLVWAFSISIPSFVLDYITLGIALFVGPSLRLAARSGLFSNFDESLQRNLRIVGNLVLGPFKLMGSAFVFAKETFQGFDKEGLKNKSLNFAGKIIDISFRSWMIAGNTLLIIAYGFFLFGIMPALVALPFGVIFSFFLLGWPLAFFQTAGFLNSKAHKKLPKRERVKLRRQHREFRGEVIVSLKWFLGILAFNTIVMRTLGLHLGAS